MTPTFAVRSHSASIEHPRLDLLRQTTYPKCVAASVVVFCLGRRQRGRILLSAPGFAFPSPECGRTSCVNLTRMGHGTSPKCCCSAREHLTSHFWLDLAEGRLRLDRLEPQRRRSSTFFPWTSTPRDKPRGDPVSPIPREARKSHRRHPPLALRPRCAGCGVDRLRLSDDRHRGRGGRGARKQAKETVTWLTSVHSRNPAQEYPGRDRHPEPPDQGRPHRSRSQRLQRQSPQPPGLCRPRRDRGRLVEALQRGPRLSLAQAGRSQLQRADLRQPLRRRGRRDLHPDLVAPS